MDRVAKSLGLALLLAATDLHAGCGSSASGLTSNGGEVPKVTNDDPMAKPTRSGWAWV